MEQETKKPPNPKYCVPRGSLWVWVLFSCFFFFATDSSLRTLRGQCGTAGRTKGLWAEAAKNSDPGSEVGSLHLETVRGV